jgi:hypothetical protein
MHKKAPFAMGQILLERRLQALTRPRFNAWRWEESDGKKLVKQQNKFSVCGWHLV